MIHPFFNLAFKVMRAITGKIALMTSLLLIPVFNAFAEEERDPGFFRNLYIQPVMHYGGVWAHRSDLRVFSSYGLPWFELNVGREKTGREQWEQLYNYPSLGAGFSRINLGHDALGQASSLFGYTDIRLTRGTNFSSGFKLALGLGHFNRVYDSDTNPLNVAVSTNINLYFNLAYFFTYNLNDHLSLRAGAGLVHFSNGAYKKPNRGLNVLQTSIGVKYRFSPDHRLIEEYIEPAETNYGLTIALTGGVMQPDAGMPNYGVHSFSLNTTRRFNHLQRLGLGFDLFYNEYVFEKLNGEEMTYSKWQSLRKGAYLSHELIFKNMVIVANLGFYFPHEITPPTPYYQRIGLRYYISKGTLLNLSLIAHKGRAEVVEWGIGYSF